MQNPLSRSGDATESIRFKRVILTYHRIIDDQDEAAPAGPGDRQFYDIPMSRFVHQAETVAAHVRAYQTGARLPHVELTFDDGTRDHLAVARALAKLGLSGIFFIITARLGEPGYLSRRELRTVLDLGHRIGSHTVTHRKICDLGDADLRFELERSRDDLEQETGRKVEWFAPPGGYINEQSSSAALTCGYRHIRTMEWGYSSVTQSRQVGSIPIVPSTSGRVFNKIIQGRASFIGFQLKEVFKRTVGESAYVAIRNRWGALRSAR